MQPLTRTSRCVCYFISATCKHWVIWRNIRGWIGFLLQPPANDMLAHHNY
uniref:Uncharacterized protein n=1 Tax=Klebsiella pneumoniae TaxID=573 RepID=A0A8B0SSR6_KLEPN|nr:hypothetical protein [Klebsiella pneumoniae]